MPRSTSRLFKWLGIAVLTAIVLTALPVLLLRVWHPSTSAFMLRAHLESTGARTAQ